MRDSIGLESSSARRIADAAVLGTAYTVLTMITMKAWVFYSSFAHSSHFGLAVDKTIPRDDVGRSLIATRGH